MKHFSSFLKGFYLTVKCFLSNVIGNGKLLTNDFQIAEIFNKYFQNLMPNLDLNVQNNLLCQTPRNGDEVLSAIHLFLYKQSIFDPHPQIV